MAKRRKTTDYRDFKPVEVRDAGGKTKERHDTGAGVTGEYWWKADATVRHDAVWAAVDALEQQQSVRREVNALCARLYGDKEANGASKVVPTGDKVTLNIVSMVTDTLSAKIAKSKPKATFVTDGGNWGQQQRAKKLDKFVQGVKHKARFYPKLRKAFRDCCRADIGVLKVYRDADGICVDWIFPDELLVDARDGLYGEPRSMYQRKAVPREVLLGLFPEAADAIRDADGPAENQWQLGEDTNSLDDMVEVREAWHLPSGPKAGDGRRSLCISSGTLEDVEWKRSRFPFVVLRYSEPLSGFYGRGVAERLIGWQRSINRKLRTINEAMRLMAAPQYWVQSGADVPVETMTNEVGAIVRSAVKPQLLNERGIVVPPQLIDAVQQDVQRALEQEGISQLSVSSRKPAGLDSGAALREYNDIESERFILVGQMLEEAAVEAAELIIDEAEDAAAAKQPLNIAVEGKRGVERISWDEVDMARDAFVIKAFPTSSLPQTPAARRKAVEEMVAAGWVDGPQARRLLDMPDLEAANSLDFAGEDEIDALVEDFLHRGKSDDLETLQADVYRPPEPGMHLEYGLKRFNMELRRATRLNAPESRLSLLRDWIAAAETLLQPPPDAAAPPAPGAMPPGAPPALPLEAAMPAAGGMPA